MMTNSKPGSNEYFGVAFYESWDDFRLDELIVNFSTIPQFRFDDCSDRSYHNFTKNLPTATKKIWRISISRKSEVRFQIHCNNVEVADIVMTEDFCGRFGAARWRNKINLVLFGLWDISDYYRIVQAGLSIYDKDFSKFS